MWTSWRIAFVVVLIVVLVAVLWWNFADQGTASRGMALTSSLGNVAKQGDPDKALVARIIQENYQETRINAARWSGVYWGATFFAAIFSAIAALVLKLESIGKNDAVKKDVAATLSVVAALLVTVSTSGEFQKKWQANRAAAAELERTGYQFLEHDGANARTYLAQVGEILRSVICVFWAPVAGMEN